MALGFLNKMIGLKVAAPPAERMHRVAGRELPLRIVENARARRLTLRIEPGGRGLRVTVPPGLSRSRVRLVDHANAGILARVAFQNFQAAIGRAVVHEEAFPVFPRLGEQGRDTFV